MKHNNSQTRIYGESVYFITCDTHDSIEFFKNETRASLWIEETYLCKTKMIFLIYALCLSTNHFYWMIQPRNTIADYYEIMHFMKRNFTIDANCILGYGEKWDYGDEWDCRLQKKKLKLEVKYELSV